MLDTAVIGSKLRELGFDFYSGVPCSFLKNLINYAINHVSYVAAANEGDAVAIATGAYVGGRKSVVLMQNSGLTNATSPLASLNPIFKVPVLGFVSLRGEPGGHDEPQHKVMGLITTTLLDALGVVWEYLSPSMEEASAQLERANRSIEGRRTFFFVVKKNTFATEKLRAQTLRHTCNKTIDRGSQPAGERPSRAEALKAVLEARTAETVLLATTGYTGRELYEISDLDCNFYMVGSMGCVSSMGLGLALAQRNRPVLVLDGDGAALMRMGAMATAGYYAPDNLLHVLLDNASHESTGGQFTVSPNVDWPAVAWAGGYPRAYGAHDLQGLSRRIRAWQEDPRLTFLVMKTRVGVSENLSRPSVTPEEVASRLMRFLGTAK